MTLQPIGYLAETLAISKGHARRLIHQRAVEPPVVIQVGGSHRINPEKLEEWIEAGGSGYRDKEAK